MNNTNNGAPVHHNQRTDGVDEKVCSSKNANECANVTDNLSFKSGYFLPGILDDNRGINFLMQRPLDPFPPYVA